MTAKEVLEMRKSDPRKVFSSGVSWDEFQKIIDESLETAIPMKPVLQDHDHDNFFSKSVECGNCGEVIGSWSYGRDWCDSPKKFLKFFIEHHKYCNECGHPIDWNGV